MTIRLILQCKISQRDAWASIGFLHAEGATTVQAGAELITKECQIYWRMITDDSRQRVVAVYDGRRWHAVDEENLEPAPLPWSESGGLFGGGMLKRLRRNEYFPTTVQSDDSKN